MRKLSRAPFFGVAAFVAASMAHASISVDTSQILGCGDNAKEWETEVQGTVVLNEAFLPTQKEQRQKIFVEAATNQLKYVEGFFQNDQGLGKAGRYEISADRGTPEILSTRAVKYPFALKIDDYGLGGNRDPQLYFMRAFRRGQTTTDDSAVEVHYRAKARMAVCTFPSAKNAIRPEAIPVPPDPYLAFWYVRPEERRPMKYGRAERIGSPCATHEMADFGDSEQYWYLWDPNSDAKDAKGKPYRCRDYNPPERFTTPARISYLSPVLDAAGLSEAKNRFTASKPIRISAIFGKVETKVFLQLSSQEFSKDVAVLADGAENSGEKLWQSFLKAHPFQRTPATTLEPGAQVMMQFFRFLPNIAKIAETKTLRNDDGALELELKGKLRKSEQPFVLRAYFGSTSIYDGAAAQHWAVLGDAVAHDDVIFYAGHAGLGENLKLENVARFAKTSVKKLMLLSRKKPYQIFGLFNCYSYYHFGEDILAMRQERDTDLILSGTRDVRAEQLLGILHALDRALGSSDTNFMGSVESFVSQGNFLVLRHQAFR